MHASRCPMTARHAGPMVVSLLVGLSSSAAVAQTLAGRALDKVTRAPLRAIPVAIVDDSGHVVASAQTDSGGVFYLDAPRAGQWRLSFGTNEDIPFVTAPMKVADGEVIEHVYALSVVAPPATEREVDEPVRVASPPRIRYPDVLRSIGTAGEVLLSFVVDTMGRPVMTTVKVLRATDLAFVTAAREGLGDARYTPARVRGQKVRQLVQQPFVFNMADTPMQDRRGPGVREARPP